MALPIDTSPASPAWFCPRRRETGAVPGSVFMTPIGGDSWREDDRSCSYCGSIHPDAFMAEIAKGTEIVPTDKNYKVYVGTASQKFYFQHLSTAQKQQFVDYLNAKAIKLATPGYFYVRPFFIAAS